MKKTLVSLTILFSLFLLTFSQGPEQFTYQAVIRDGSGTIQAHTDYEVLVSLKQGSINGEDAFSETHTGTTNELGMINLIIGSVNMEDMALIDWSDGPFFININVNGTDLGTIQLLSVPYALYANKAGNVFSREFQDLLNAPDLALYATLDMADHNLSNLANPDNAQDAATKYYVDILEYKLKKAGVLPFEDGDTMLLKDIDNHIYSAVKIGPQWWTTENLRTAHYNDGTPIAHVSDNQQWIDLNTGAYCWVQNDSASSCGMHPISGGKPLL